MGTTEVDVTAAAADVKLTIHLQQSTSAAIAAAAAIKRRASTAENLILRSDVSSFSGRATFTSSIVD